MADVSIPQHRTCEICGEESARAEFADLAGNVVHNGLCFLEYGLIQNTMPESGLRAGIEKLGALHRERCAAWRLIADQRDAQVAELRAALYIAPCLCSGDFRCSRCKALDSAPSEDSDVRAGEFLPPSQEQIIGYLESEISRRSASNAALSEALRAILSEPYGCPFCDSGKLRNVCKEHAPTCGFALAAVALPLSEDQVG